MSREHGNAGFPAAGANGAEPPEPDPAFRWIDEPWGFALRCAPLEAGAQHLFTSMQPVFPTAPAGDERWPEIVATLGVPPDRLVRVRQVHGGVVRILRAGEVDASASRERPEADAIVSDVAGLALLVLVADCVPLLIAEPVAGAAAAIHAGWRGTCAGIAREAVLTLAREFGARPERMVAAIGPSIGPQDYEVGEEVLRSFREAGHGRPIDRWFRRDEPDEPLRLDLWSANADQLAEAGIPSDAIHHARLSTRAHPRWLASYRRDGAAAGRMAAVIVVPPAAGPPGAVSR